MNRISLVCLWVLGLILTTPTAATTLRTDIVVNAPVITLGDLLRDAGHQASTPVFKAPAIGETGTVSASRVAKAAEKHGIVLSGPSLGTITIHRAARTIPASDLESVAREAFMERYAPEIDDVEVDLIFRGLAETLVLDPSLDGAIEVEDTTFDRRNGQLVATLRVDGEAGSYRKRIAARAEFYRPVAVYAHRIARDTVITPQHITYERRRISNSDLARGLSPAPEMQDMVGKAATRNVSSGAVIRMRDLDEPRLVRRNEEVTAIFEAGAIQLTSKVKAMADGPLGATVPLLNLKSRRTIEGTVVGMGVVRVHQTDNSINLRRDLASLTQVEGDR